MIKVIITDLADETLKEITDFLKVNWTQKELDVMLTEYYTFLENLELGIIKPRFYKNLEKDIYFSLIVNKQVTIYFEYVDQNTIRILLFWPNKKDPQLLKSFLGKL
jgi:hypothetical protein